MVDDKKKKKKEKKKNLRMMRDLEVPISISISSTAVINTYTLPDFSPSSEEDDPLPCLLRMMMVMMEGEG